MARVNIDILGISELKWMEMGKFNSDDHCYILDFPGSSAGKESACNAGDLDSIPGLGRSAGEGIGYPLQYPWTSLVAQLVKNLSAMQKTSVQFLGWEGPLKKG